MFLLVVLAGSALCGYAFQRLGVPGGLILGAMVPAAAFGLVSGRELSLPRPVQDTAFILIGASIGLMVTRDILAHLRPVAVGAVLGALMVILAGVGIAYALRLLGVAPPEDLLATSPGALSVIQAMAIERGVAPAQVAVFHLVRIIMVMWSLPLLLKILDAKGP